MSTYALSTLFPSSSCHNDHATSSSHQIASHTHPIPQYQSCQQTPSTNEVTSGNAEKLECVDIAVTNANLDPRSLYKRRGKKEKYFSSAQSRKFEAVTFELKITFNRRQYTVRRPFYRLRNLHAELVKECEKLGMVMPELPTRYDSEGNPYSIPVMFPIARSGLSMLQSTMYSYTPVVDGWFSHVCKALPRSPSLINFIWEPPERKMEQQLASINEEEEEDEIDDDDDDYYGYSINPVSSNSNGKSSWKRMDSNTIKNPDGEMRTKHDVELKNMSNAHRLGLDGGDSSIGDKAYNSFRSKLKKGVVKGVASHGHGRAENMAHDRTRGGALDGTARLLIQNAINNETISTMNGVVKEGKEAIVYHANGANGGHDLAVKVFKRIQEFRQRGSYVDGDPRYHKQKFSSYGKREQVELWSQKEFRNLTRANSAGVPVPLPVLCDKNMLFMRFLGEDGWPSPQLREIDIRRGSSKWIHLYCQTLVAVRRLYHCARLVHADLSEYNILLCPSHQVDQDVGVGDERTSLSSSSSKKEDHIVSLQSVLIDFGQSVDNTHPSANEFLARDVSRLNFFFEHQGIKTLNNTEALDFVLAPCKYEDENDDITNSTNKDLAAVCEEDGDTADNTNVHPTLTTTAHATIGDFEIVDSNNAHQDDNILVGLNDKKEEDFVIVDNEGHESSSISVEQNEDTFLKKELSQQQRFSVTGWDDIKDYNKLFSILSLRN